MIYIDTSVVLAHVFAEDRRVPAGLWREILVSSRLLQYEAWNRTYALSADKVAREALQQSLDMIAFVELSQPALERAMQPFPVPVRTLDAMHLATLEFLRLQGHSISLASYDLCMLEAAKKMKIARYEL